MIRDYLKSLPLLSPAVKAARQARRQLFLRSEGEAQLQRAFERIHGRPVDVEYPTLHSERLMAWLIRLHRESDRRFSRLADKLASRDYARDRLGPQYLTEIYWEGTDPHEVPFDDLPERYVIKPTHSSGQVILADPELDRAEAIEEMSFWLQHNYYWAAREYQYLHIPPRLMVEECIDDGTEGGPFDYSFWCFNGTPKLSQLRKYPRVVNQFYDLDWNLLPLKARRNIPEVDLSRPPLFEEMVEVAARLAEGIEFVRVDLFSPPGKILFSELTFTPAAARSLYHPPEWEEKLGRMWE